MIGDPVNECARLSDLAKTVNGSVLANASAVGEADGEARHWRSVGAWWCAAGGTHRTVHAGRVPATRSAEDLRRPDVDPASGAPYATAMTDASRESASRKSASRKSWPDAHIPDQSGRTVIITGANSGLGADTAKALADRGRRSYRPRRNTDKADQVAAQIGPAATVRELDLADLDSVRRFADSADAADILINNAGIMAVLLRRTAQGFESQMGTNHLSATSALTALLRPISDRVVTLSSFMHLLGRIKLDDLSWGATHLPALAGLRRLQDG